MYKEDPQKQGVLFSIENQNDKFLKIRGVAQFFINHILSGKTFEETRNITLSEYNVSAEVLDKDLQVLQGKLTEVGFIIV